MDHAADFGFCVVSGLAVLARERGRDVVRMLLEKHFVAVKGLHAVDNGDLAPFEKCFMRGAHRTVVFHTATYGINTPGTVYRMDDVPIPLRPAFDSPLPSDYEVLKGIERRVRELAAVIGAEAGEGKE